MAAGFMIRCLNCGQEQRVEPGRRADYRSEAIVFGTDNYGADQMSCECGNAIEEHSRYERSGDGREFVVDWRDIGRTERDRI